MRDRILRYCAHIACNYPKTILVFFNVLALISLVYAVFQIDISTDYDALRSNDLPYAKAYNSFKSDFKDNNFLLVVIESGKEKDKGKKIAKLIADRVKKLKSVEKVFYRVDIDFFKKNSLLFLSKENHATLAKVIESSKYELKKIGQVSNINSFFTYFINRFKSKDISTVDTILLYYFVREFELAFEKGVKHSVIKDFLYKQLREFEDGGYFFSDDKELLFVLVLPRKDYSSIKLIEGPLEDIRDIVSSVKQDYQGTNIGITGQPAIQSDEMEVTSREVTYATLISIVIVTLLFIVSFRNIARPLLSVYTLVISIMISFGIASIYPGHLTILSIVFAVMMIGLGIDFGIHIISRYHEELSKKHTIYTAIENTLLRAGRSSLSGIITSSIAFYMALFIDFKGLQELGFIAGTGIIVILFSTLLLLPALLVLYDRGKTQLETSSFIQLHVLSKILVYPKIVISFILVITLFFVAVLLFKGLPEFNNNLMDLQAHGIESVNYEMKLISSSKGSSWFSTLFVSKDLEENDTIVSKLRAKESVGKIETIRDYIPKNQKANIQKSSLLKEDLSLLMSRFSSVPKDFSLPNIRKDIKKIRSLVTLYYKNKKESAVTGILGTKKRLFDTLDNIYKQLGEDNAKDRVNLLQERFFKDIVNAHALVKQLLNPSEISIESLPPVIQFRFVGKGNKLVVYASSKENIWHDAALLRYIKDIRSVSPNVVGSTINFYEDTKRMKSGFLNISIYVLLFVFFLLLIDFSSFYQALIALVPLLISMVWLFGIMSLANIYFNISNSFSIPLLIGISIAYGIHIVHRFVEDKNAFFIVKSTGTAIILTALTTIVGFGSLLIATHRGTVSLGLIMVIGILSSLVISMVLLPAVFEIIRKQIQRDNKIS